MKVAIEGCAHGELDKIYDTIAALERKNNLKVDLLIVCGDFQAVRNPADLECMAVPPKFRKLNTFYKYYSGEKKAPILTIFIGGNHEASNFLSELPYGGWVCPNIYYMGYANVINVGGLRIAGLSGIYKGQDYLKGHYEHLPYDISSVKSVYHVRNIDVFRLKQIKAPLDICISHDWPKGVYKHGDMEQLLRFKPFFREEMESNKLGSQPAEELLMKLKPTHWFAAHLHCKFHALVEHEDVNRPFTKFLALDKCLPRRRFLQLLDIGEKVQSINIEYDLEWLCVLQKTNHLLNCKRTASYMPGPGGLEPWDFSVSEEEILSMKGRVGDLKVPDNFTVTAPKFKVGDVFHKRDSLQCFLNPQTQEFCKLVKITDPIEVLSSVDCFKLNVSSTETDDSSLNPEESTLSDDTECPSEKDASFSSDFFIDRVGSFGSSNVDNYIKDNPYDLKTCVEESKKEVFPEIKSDTSSATESKSSPIVFKRRNASLYNQECIPSPVIEVENPAKRLFRKNNPDFFR